MNSPARNNFSVNHSTQHTETSHAWIGIDVAKATLDACLLTGETTRHKSFANSPAGYVQLLAWIQAHAPERDYHFAMEVTATYSQGLALFLATKQQRVSLLNPARVHYAALSRGTGNKTDKVDAFVIADFCRKENPPLWQPPSPERSTLADLVRRREDLLAVTLQEKNRCEQAYVDKAVKASLARVIRALERETERIEKHIAAHVAAHANLQSEATLLESIPGIRHLTAWKILAEMGGTAQRFGSSGAAAAYAGLAPREHRSGSSVHKKTRLSKRGNAQLRKALYFPTVTALTWNPLVKAFYARLVAAGKPRMVALGAAMRKLLMIAVGVLRGGVPFRADWADQARVALAEKGREKALVPAT